MTVAVLREMAVKAPGPRNAFVRFRMGQVFGEDGERQRMVLEAVLGIFASARTPGEIVDLPFRWKRR